MKTIGFTVDIFGFKNLFVQAWSNGHVGLTSQTRIPQNVTEKIIDYLRTEGFFDSLKEEKPQ